MSLARYMALCLGHPVHGYYRTRDPLGARGDFVTAPEISQMFGELIGIWIAVTWASMGGPSDLVLTELGPGRGTLMADALRALGRAAPDFQPARPSRGDEPPASGGTGLPPRSRVSEPGTMGSRPCPKGR